jgi:hypothetical protein
MVIMKKPNTQRAKNAILGITIWLVFNVLGVVYMIIFLCGTGNNEKLYRYMLIGMPIVFIGNFITAIISIVVFALWFRSVSLFIPIVNLYKPYTIMRKLCENTDAVDAWEIFWVLSNIAFYIFFPLFIYLCYVFSRPLIEIELVLPFIGIFTIFSYNIKQIIDILLALSAVIVIYNVMKKEQLKQGHVED